MGVFSERLFVQLPTEVSRLQLVLGSLPGQSDRSPRIPVATGGHGAGRATQATACKDEGSRGGTETGAMLGVINPWQLKLRLLAPAVTVHPQCTSAPA
jgi:hypothetical protein